MQLGRNYELDFQGELFLVDRCQAGEVHQDLFGFELLALVAKEGLHFLHLENPSF